MHYYEFYRIFIFNFKSLLALPPTLIQAFRLGKLLRTGPAGAEKKHSIAVRLLNKTLFISAHAVVCQIFFLLSCCTTRAAARCSRKHLASCAKEASLESQLGPTLCHRNKFRVASLRLGFGISYNRFLPISISPFSLNVIRSAYVLAIAYSLLRTCNKLNQI